MTKNLIEQALKLSKPDLNVQTWLENEDTQGRKVAKLREYYEGNHDANLSKEMRKSLRVTSSDIFGEFCDNYMPVIVDTKNDRIKLLGILADNEPVTTWAADVYDNNRLDAKQISIHQATIRDGNAYVLVDAKKTKEDEIEVRFTPELAYDGVTGVMVFYDSTAAQKPAFAVKTWQESEQEVSDTTRINIYYADRLEKYVSVNDGAVTAYTEDGESVISWVKKDGKAIGLPMLHFRNKLSSDLHTGISDLQDVIPLQNALNRTFYSMVATAENTGFPIRYVVGTSISGEMSPGMFKSFYIPNEEGGVKVPANDYEANWLSSIRVGHFEQASLVPFIDQANWLKSEIYRITNTPESETGLESGEAKKQREVKLFAQVLSFETLNGNVWEDAFALAHTIAAEFIDNPGEYETLSADWKSPEVRDATKVIDNILKLANAGYVNQRHVLTEVAEIFGWDKERIEQIIEETSGADVIPQETPALFGVEDMAGALDAVARAEGAGTEVVAQPAETVATDTTDTI